MLEAGAGDGHHRGHVVEPLDRRFERAGAGLVAVEDLRHHPVSRTGDAVRRQERPGRFAHQVSMDARRAERYADRRRRTANHPVDDPRARHVRRLPIAEVQERREAASVPLRADPSVPHQHDRRPVRREESVRRVEGVHASSEISRGM